MKQVSVKADVCVVGGGMAGVCAALAAARNGARVALVQDRPVLGGNASSEIRVGICGADHSEHVWRETGILEELRIESLAWNYRHSPYRQDLALYDACRREPHLELFLNARMIDCRVEPTATTSSKKAGKKVVSCEAIEVTSDRTICVEADYFVDSSGDGALAYAAGAEYMKGREGRDKFGESLAPEKGDNYTLGHSILFEAVDVGKPVPFNPPPWAIKFESDEDLPHRWHSGPVGFWWIEWGGTVDTVTDSESIKDELLAAAIGLWDHIKNKGDHGFANYALDWIGFVPGRRESRRFVGDVILTQQDLQSARHWPDQVAYGGWPIDTHPPLGFRSPEPPCSQIRLDKPYGIPLRACYSKDFDNLFLAGRDASASSIAFASTRVMATCALMGQAVGTAAAVGLRYGATVREIVDQHINEVQQVLLKDGVYLLDIRNEDPADLARSASVTASSSAGNKFAPEKVIDGINHPDKSDWHCWRSDSSSGFPAWIELRWPEQVQVGRVQIVFDTDFESTLALVRRAAYMEMIKPVPRAVTVKDADIQVEVPGGWQNVACVRGNYQRLVRAEFAPVTTKALRIYVTETWGANYASIFEIRCES